MSEDTSKPAQQAELLARPSSPAMDAILGETFSVLDKGHLRVIDYMGDEAAIVQAARASYGKGTKSVSEDTNLIRYLMRHRHTTPLEMCELKLHVRMPMDHWRQQIRHRMACLAANTKLHFDLPGGISKRGNQLYQLTVGEVFQKFQPTRGEQGNPLFKAERVQRMQLRCVNEDTMSVAHTNIVGVWSSGTKAVYKVTTRNGATATMSADHLCLTTDGWKKLRDIVNLKSLRTRRSPSLISIGPGRNTGVVPRPNSIDETSEVWVPIVGWEGYYEVSSQGRIRRIVGGKGSRSFGRCKKVTISNGRAVVSLNRPGLQVVKLVHAAMLESFSGPRPDTMEVCHTDGNSLNNVLGNLRWGTTQTNADDRTRVGATTALRVAEDPIVEVKRMGKQMTYDLEVAGPWHNFSAGGLIVHNSVNEYSTRYSEAIDDKQETLPGQWRLQATSNKQGSSGLLADSNLLVAEALSLAEHELHQHAEAVYKGRLEAGIAREQARKDLPLSTYTEAYWKIDLHNLLHYLSLRMDSHAQLEIRQYATVIGEQVVARWLPNVWQAFLDYRLNAVSLSAQEQVVLQALAYYFGTLGEAASCNTPWTQQLHDPVVHAAVASIDWFDMATGKPKLVRGNKKRELLELEAKMPRLGWDVGPWDFTLPAPVQGHGSAVETT